MKTNSNIFTNALILGVAVLTIGGGANAAKREGRASNLRPAQVNGNYRPQRATRILRVELMSRESVREAANLVLRMDKNILVRRDVNVIIRPKAAHRGELVSNREGRDRERRPFDRTYRHNRGFSTQLNC